MFKPSKFIYMHDNCPCLKGMTSATQQSISFESSTKKLHKFMKYVQVHNDQEMIFKSNIKNKPVQQ